ncbi:MAG: DUF3021 domain-containing protein [Clostridia bacterium]|nr:DUF3021 domain-containing protein [Clostridia bacterium]
MKRYVKEFFHRGMLFAGFGPIILGVIYLVLQKTMPDFSLSGWEVCLGIASTYFLAFLQAGASVFPQIDHWSPLKSLLCHIATVYGAYVSCYLVNSWIPFRIEILLLFTAIFVASFLGIWLTIYLIVRGTRKTLNKKLN